MFLATVFVLHYYLLPTTYPSAYYLPTESEPRHPRIPRRVVLESRVLADEGQRHVARGAVALLGEDELRLALLRLLVVHLVAVDEQHQVGVLLDRARLAQVGEFGLALAAALL